MKKEISNENLLLEFWINNLRFSNNTILKRQIEDIFLPVAKSKLNEDEVKYFVKRFYRELNKRLNELPINSFLKDERVIKFSKVEYDWDSWAEWILLKVNSVEEAHKVVHDFDPEWAGEINLQLREYDCTGETFSSGMKFTKINDNLVVAYKRYDLDV